MDIAKIKKNLIERKEMERICNMNRHQKASADFDKIVDMIINQYAPTQIIQWGSLLHPEQFDKHSDIDIAIKGVPDATRFFALLEDAMKLTSFPLDIVQLEKIEPEFAEIIMMKGKIVYGT